MRVIVFDFFGVVCSEIAPFVLPKYMSPEEAVRYKAAVVYDADLGRITQDEMFENLSKIARVPPKQLEAEFWSCVRIDPEIVALIENLRTTHRVALLTNAIVPIFRQITTRHDLERLFETILVSSEEGMAKPDPAFYTLLTDRMNVRASDCLFIDDNPVNIEAAHAAGMNGLLFEGVEKLRRDLAESGATPFR
jgi:epoxide hydrolase-like predicted phosphatase